MAAPLISELPAPPSRSDSPDDFATKADAFLSALPAFRSEANTQAVFLDEAAGSAIDSATAAGVSKTAAESAATTAASAANYRGDYSAGTTYQIGQSVSYSGSQWVAKTVNTGVTPAAGSNWLQIVNSFSSPTITGAVDIQGSVKSGIVAMAGLTVDCSSGNYFTKTISGNSTFVFSNAPASRVYSFTMELTHTSGTVTWPTSVKWPGDTAPTLATGKTHLFAFITDDGGTRWRGVVQKDYVN